MATARAAHAGSGAYRRRSAGQASGRGAVPRRRHGRDALQADGEDLGGTGGDAPPRPEPFVFDPQTPQDAIELFPHEHCFRDDERCRTKAQVLFDALRERMPPAVADLLPTMPKFGAAIAAAGITKRRTSEGFPYIGLDLRPFSALKHAAE